MQLTLTFEPGADDALAPEILKAIAETMGRVASLAKKLSPNKPAVTEAAPAQPEPDNEAPPPKKAEKPVKKPATKKAEPKSEPEAKEPAGDDLTEMTDDDLLKLCRKLGSQCAQDENIGSAVVVQILKDNTPEGTAPRFDKLDRDARIAAITALREKMAG